MSLPREEVVAGFQAEILRFEELLRSIGDDEWTSPSRCEGWTAADVAAHVTGQLSDVVNGRFDGLGTPEVTQREVEERRGRSPKELADELVEVMTIGAQVLAGIDDGGWARPAPAGPGTPRDGSRGPLLHARVAAHDTRRPTGRA